MYPQGGATNHFIQGWRKNLQCADRNKRKTQNITIVTKEKGNAQGWESIQIGETSSQNDLEVSPTQVGSFSCSGTESDTTPY